MAQPKITFNVGEGGLGRPLAGEDHISGLVWWNDTLPTGFNGETQKTFFSLQGAESAGIVEGSDPFGVLWYQISEFFRINEKGVLHVGIYPIPAGAYNYTELQTLQAFADGKIRQFAVWENLTAFTTTPLNIIQGVLTDLLEDYQPAVAIYSGDTSAIAPASLVDLTGQTAQAVSVCVAQDGDAKGAALAVSEGFSIPTLGAQLGALSAAKVNESIAWVGKFPLVTGTELKVPAFGDGTKTSSLASTLLDTIVTYGYTYIKKFIGRENTYFVDSLTATAANSDFSTLENNRTIQKAIREIYVRSLDLLNSPIVVNEDGTLSEDAIQTFRSKAVEALDAMQANTEISAYSVEIDPTQNVLSTSKIEIAVKIVPVGVSNELVYNIGYTTNIS